ncbi:MAG: hypothetical protein FWG32_00330 [Oscillospiraceae bacterium]|nr:hypothetical protein [Oscillospiraceae bacterium]
MDLKKRRRGDRRDGYLVRDVDPLHLFMPYLMPNRADNEAFISETIDLTPILEFLEKKNSDAVGRNYNIFHVIAAAVVKTITLRPRLNRFIKGHRTYDRKDLSLAFVVKKQFSDSAEEALAFATFDGDTTLELLYDTLIREISACRDDKQTDNSTKGMEFFSRFPRWLMRVIVLILRIMDYYGKVPVSLVKTDPNHATAFISNLGSIKLNAAYHHLNNWGTNSLFLVIGEKYPAAYRKEDGGSEYRPSLNLGLTVDERIADGYYYSGSIRLLKHLLAHPELLDLPAKEEVEF